MDIRILGDKTVAMNRAFEHARRVETPAGVANLQRPRSEGAPVEMTASAD
jgi:hypothetical protein